MRSRSPGGHQRLLLRRAQPRVVRRQKLRQKLSNECSVVNLVSSKTQRGTAGMAEFRKRGEEGVTDAYRDEKELAL